LEATAQEAGAAEARARAAADTAVSEAEAAHMVETRIPSPPR
jgi:hypothetical protein